jgi:hypothetical protein
MTSDDREDEGVTVRLPAELPVLTRSASRILLAILIELTEADVPEGDGHD